MVASVPNTFSNNTIADADQVNADFAALVAYINSNNWLIAPATVNIAPSNPAGTSSATRVMMGVGDVCTITPARNGKIVFMMHFNVSPTGGAGGTNWHLRYGTGSRPLNGVAETGTAAMAQSDQAIGNSSPTLMGVVTGLTVGVAYWFDASIAVVAPATATSIGGISATAFELS